MQPARSFPFLLAAAVAMMVGCGPSAGQNAAAPTVTSIPATPSSSAQIISAVAAGDTLTMTFAQGAPGFTFKPQPSSHFMAGSGRGTWVDVAGAAGAEITLSGLRGDLETYSGPTSITSQGPLLLEARYVSAFEGYADWAIGFSKPACATVVPAGSTLTFHFVAAPSSGCS